MSKNEKVVNDPIVDFQTKSMKNEIILFKNETLRDFNDAQKKILDKYINLDSEIKSKFESYETRINAYEMKITELSNLIHSDNTIKEKVEQLLEFKDKTNDTMLTQKIRLDNLRNDLKSNVTRIDKILTDSVIYPGVIGGINRYKTFHDLIDYVLTQCSLNLTFREKSILDFKGYKQKLEGLIEVFNQQINKILNTTSEFTKTCVKDSEEKFKSMISILEDRMSETRIENANYAIGLEKITKTLQEELKNINIVKSQLYKKVDSAVANLRKDNTKVIKLFTGYKKEFILLQHKFTQLSEFIKDMRFRINLKEDVERREFARMSNLINFDKKKKGFYDGLDDINKLNNKDLEGKLKDYISGKITAEDILKKNNSLNNIELNDPKRKSFGGEAYKNLKKFNSFGNIALESDKKSINNLIRGSMSIPMKKLTLRNDNYIGNGKKRNSEIKEEDEEEFLSNSEVELKKRQTLNNLKNDLMDNEIEKDNFYENLYEDANIDEDEEEKNNLTKQVPNNLTNTNTKSKHNRGRLRNSMVNIMKVDKILDSLKKSNPDIKVINSAVEPKKEKEENKKKDVKNIKLDILKNINNNNNIIDDSIYSDVNDDAKNSNKVINSENNKSNSKGADLNNNKSSTSYNTKLKSMGEQFNNKGKTSPRAKKTESADRCKFIKKGNIFKDKDYKKVKVIKNTLYNSEFFLPSNLVHNATIFAYKTKDENYFRNRKISPEQKSKNVSEIKSVTNLILKSFCPRNGKHDINADERNIIKIISKRK